MGNPTSEPLDAMANPTAGLAQLAAQLSKGATLRLDGPIPRVDKALGRSLIYEELKGDFALAGQFAEECLAEPVRQDTCRDLASAHLARGLVYALQGEYTAALRCFDEADRRGEADPVLRLQAVAGHTLATYIRYTYFPFASVSSMEPLDHWEGFEYIRGQELRWSELMREVSGTADPSEAVRYPRLLSHWLISRDMLYNLRVHPLGDMTGVKDAVIGFCRQHREQAQLLAPPPDLLAYVDLMSGDLYRQIGEEALALEMLGRACDAYTGAGDRAGAATCHLTRGDWLAARYNSPVVWGYHLTEVVDLAGEPIHGPGEVSGVDHAPADLTAASAAYSEAEELYRQAGARRGLAALQLRYGYLAMLAGDYGQTTEHVSRALQGFREAGDFLGVWIALAHLALSGIGEGRYPPNRATARAIGAWGREEGSLVLSLGLGLLCVQVGKRWLLRQGDYERALACLRLAEVLFRELGTVYNLASCLEGLGRVWDLVGESDAALGAYADAMDRYAEAARTRPAVAIVAWSRALVLSSSISDIYMSRGDVAGIERSTARLRSLAAPPSASIASDGLDLQTIDLMNRFVDDRVAWASVIVPLHRAVSAREAGDSPEMQQQFERALAATHQLPDDNRDLLQALVLGRWERYPEAIAAYRRHSGKHASSGYFAHFFGDALAPTAHRFLGPRQVRVRTIQSGHFFNNVKDYASAKACWEELELTGGPDWWRRQASPWWDLSAMGQTYQGLGQVDHALEYYDRAITEFEERRDLLHRDELKVALAGESGGRNIYLRAAQAALLLREEARGSGDEASAQVYATRAFEYAEKGRARALLDLMAGGSGLSRAAALLGQTADDWRQANTRLATHRGLLGLVQSQPTPLPERIAQLNEQIDTDAAELDRIEGELAASVPGFYQLTSPRGRIMALGDVQAALPPDTALVQYHLAGEHMLAWAITRVHGIETVRRIPVDHRGLDRQIRALSRALAERGEWSALANRLARTFLDPLAEAIATNSRLIVVPHGAAHLLPFQALPWDGEPLVAARSVCYLPSASILQFLRPTGESTTSERLLAVGNPANMSFQPPLGGDRVTVPPLPGAEVEAAFVASLFAQGEALLGEAATAEAVRDRIGGCGILHLATHGLLTEEAPLLASILLAEGDALHLYELMGLRLRADLVVLSACDTARGRTTGGDDVLGFTRGLLAAGARAAIVSLWPVDDVSTSLLMGEFYRRLHRGASPAVALQGAQNHLRRLDLGEVADELHELLSALESAGDAKLADRAREYRHALPTGAPSVAVDYTHPSHWAPFVLVGGL
jgi:CHAT domain-containing protein